VDYEEFFVQGWLVLVLFLEGRMLQKPGFSLEREWVRAQNTVGIRRWWIPGGG